MRSGFLTAITLALACGLSASAQSIPPAAPQASDKVPANTGPRYYTVELKGAFGEDITQTPIRDAVKDARKNKADYLIFVLDNTWPTQEQEFTHENENNFDQIFRAEQITPIFVEEIAKEWEKKPTIVFWVKKAMAGASMLPFVSPNIYMTSEAKIGGLGNLTDSLEGIGDEVVRQKQYSLRLGHAEGWAIAGGYDPRLIRAMASKPYVLSVRYEGGKPVYIERMPDPLKGEELLTDDGIGEHKDKPGEVMRGEGNDVLTLNAELAKKLLVSKGTVDSFSDLLFQLGLDRNGVEVKGQSKTITEGWVKDLVNAKKRLKQLLEEYGEIKPKPPGGYDERRTARAQQIKKLDDMINIMNKYKESITQFFLAKNRIPSVKTLEGQRDKLKLDQQADKP